MRTAGSLDRIAAASSLEPTVRPLDPPSLILHLIARPPSSAKGDLESLITADPGLAPWTDPRPE